MRPFTILLVPFTLALGGCSDGLSAPTVPAELHSAPVASVAVSEDGLPLKAYCEASFGRPQVLAPGVLRQVDTGTCRMPHLGRTTFHSDKVINVAAGTQTMNVTFTAANGDVLRATGSGTNSLARPGLVRFTANMTFAGGTGRFANATGHAVAEGEANLVEGTSWMQLDGVLSHDAADRAEIRR